MAETITAEGTKKSEGEFTLKQRFLLWALTWIGYLGIRLICPTLRWNVSIEDGGPSRPDPERIIYVFWHRAVFMATYFYRDRGIRVMTSSSFDGEYIARIIEKFGYKAVRGSSTRGAVRALLGMHTEVEAGHSVAFTIDGPKGPIYVAKPGPVLLARNTEVPIMPFYIAAENAWVLKSWDRFVIPKPFSRVQVRVGRFVQVASEISSEQSQQLHSEMQSALDRVRESAESALPTCKTQVQP